MKGIDFLDIMGEIEEKYIIETDELDIEKKKVVNFKLLEKKSQRWNYKSMMSYAAAFAVIFTMSIAGYQYFSHTSTNQDISEFSRSVSQEPVAVEEEHLGEAVSEIEEYTEEMGENEENLDEQNILEKIFSKVASFLKNLRSI